jgi:hypothetical protein
MLETQIAAETSTAAGAAPSSETLATAETPGTSTALRTSPTAGLPAWHMRKLELLGMPTLAGTPAPVETRIMDFKNNRDAFNLSDASYSRYASKNRNHNNSWDSKNANGSKKR